MKIIYTIFKKTILLISFLWIANSMFAQTYSISGKLIDAQDSIIPAASIILTNQSDSAFIQGTISNMDGVFTLNNVQKGQYLLFIQHLLYEKKSIPLEVSNTLQLGDISLQEKENELGEVSVKASRPVVKMKDNVLSYDAAAIGEKYVRSNVLEVLGDIPGVLLKDESVQLLGASKLNIAINGKPTTLTMDQVLTMLKAMPNTNIKEIQVMYAPPAKYNVKGALINIILNKSEKDELSGVVTAGYKQSRKPGANGSINLQFSKGKWETGILYSGDYAKTKMGYEIDINHNYHDTLYYIEQDMDFGNSSLEHAVQFNTAYNLSEKQQLSLVYTGNFSETDGDNYTDATFSTDETSYTESDIFKDDDNENLHNVKMDYSLNGSFNVGLDYTHYNGPSTQTYQSIVDETSKNYQTKSNQTINKWMGYFNHSLSFDNDWSVNYGANYSYSDNNNYYHYFNKTSNEYVPDASQSTINKFKETASSGFFGFSKQFSPMFSVDFSLKGEYSQMEKDSLQNTEKLWNNFRLYPSANLSFTADSNANHIFQLSLKSYATYPTYWEMSPATWYTNQYMLVQGNPELRPSQTYDASLNYIFRRKYVAVVSYNYCSKMISQIPFASEETFNTIARNENLDYSSELTAALVLPFNLGSRVTINPTIGVFHRVMKRDGAGEQSFNRSGNTFIFQYDNSVLLSKKHDVKFNLSGYYYSHIIQTIYDIDHVYDVSCALSCPLLKKKAELTVKVKDIFRSNGPVSRINFNNQQSVYRMNWDSRLLLVTFKYNFGKALKAKKVEVDDSRFRRLQ